MFFVSNRDLCRAMYMLPNYLRTYSPALCQATALQKALKKQNNSQSVPKILVFNACIRLAKTNSQKRISCNTLHISPVTMTCAVLCFQTTWGLIPELFPKFGPIRRHLRRITSSKCIRVLQPKSGLWMLAFDWLEQTLTVKIGCSILHVFPL